MPEMTDEERIQRIIQVFNTGRRENTLTVMDEFDGMGRDEVLSIVFRRMQEGYEMAGYTFLTLLSRCAYPMDSENKISKNKPRFSNG
jgi:hypothetical protein